VGLAGRVLVTAADAEAVPGLRLVEVPGFGQGKIGLDAVFRLLETGRVMLKLPLTWGARQRYQAAK